MKKTIKLCVAGFLAIILFNFQASAQEKSKFQDSDRIKKIEELELRLKLQKEQIDSLQTELKKFRNKKPMVAIPAPKDFKQMPKGATPFEFNGHQYYILPLEAKDNDDNSKLLKK